MNAKSRSIKRAKNKKRQTLARSGALLLGLYLGASFQLVLADPTGGEVVRGQGSIGQSGATTTITQQSQRLLLEWQTFNVAANENVVFNQPGSTAVALNRILDQNASEILGAIDANGRVFLINPNGIIFGSTATVNVGALVASSLNLDYDGFMAGNYDFQTLADGSPGVIVNRGLLQASTGGSITLMGSAVRNEGLILAELGHVTLAAGSSASIDFDGDGLLFFEVTGEVLENTGVLDSAVSNSGEISADGGQVLLTASTAKDVFSNVVNNEGIIRAQRIDNTGGVIRLVGSGGDTISNGVLDASAGDELSTGGDIQILGDRVGLFGEAVVDASGATGGGEVKIGGGYQGSDPTVSNSSRTFVGRDVSISADAGTSGDGGEVIVWADDLTLFYGDISARGGSDGGAGGFAEVSGKRSLTFDGTVNLGGGTLLLDPDSITIQAANPDINGDNTTGDDLINLTDLDDAALDPAGGIPTPATADSIITNTAVNGLLTGNVTLVLAAGTNVDVNAAITGADNANLTLTAPTVNLNETITLAGAGILSSGLGSPTTVNVGTDGLIQNGIDLSTTNGTVNVAAGTFDEQLNIPVAGLTLSGNGTDVLGGTATIVQSTAAPAPGVFDVEIDAIDVTVENFVFDFNGFAAVAGDGEDLALGSRGGQGIVVSDLLGPVATGVTIQNNEIYTGDGSGLGGTAIQTGKNADVTGLLIAGNTIHGDADGLGEGIYVNPQAGVGGVTISGNTIDGALFSGVSIESGDVTVSGNIITHTETGTFAEGFYGIRFIELEPVATPNYANVTIGGALLADGNTISGFQNGIRVGNDDAVGSTLTASLQNNTIQGNSIGIDLMSGAAVTGLGNTYNGNTTTDLDIDTAEDADDATADDFNVILNGADVEFRVNGGLVFSEASGDLNDATLTGSGDDDTLTADFTGGNPIPSGGITFNAGLETTGDTLVLDSGTVASVTHSFTNPSDGSVTVDGATIAYTGLEPITDNLDATDRVFTFTGGVETITLADDAGVGDGISTVDSTLGELVTFVNPTNSLSLDASAGTGGDIIQLTSIDSLAPPATISVTGTGQDDQVVLGSAFPLLPTVDGGGGTDSVNYSALASAIVLLADLTAVESVIGGGANFTLQGPDATNTWNFASATSGTVAGSTWNDFATLRGGDLVDTFNVSQAYTGTLEGGLEDDIFNLTVDSTATALGQDGDDTFNLTDGVTLTAITGGETGESATGDRLVVLGGNTTTVNALDAGSVSLADADVQAFSEIESIRGDDAAADTFAFTGIGALTGIVEGADPVGTDGATDVLDVSASNAAVTISLADNSATLLNSGGTNGFSGIESFTGDGAGVADDVFRGPDATNAWNFASATSGTVAGSTWSDFATLRGGDLVDTFNVSQAYTGTLEGGLEDDIFNLTVDSTATALGQDGDDTFNLTDGVTLTAITGGETGESATGDRLVVLGGNTTTVNALDAGSVSLADADVQAFSEIESIRGDDAAADTFAFTGIGALTGIVEGADPVGTDGATDVLDVSASNAAVTISLADNSATLLNSGGTNGFSGIESFTGDGAGVADDVFRGPDATNAWNFASATSGTVAGSTWSDFATLRGGDLVDTFNVSQAYTGTLEGGLEDDIFNLTVDSTATALGQDGDDTFNLTDGVTLTAITGGETGESATGDRLVVLGGNTTTVNALDAGSVSLADADVQAFSEIESIRGDDAAADTFAFTGIGALTGIVEGADPVGTDGATDVLDVSASNAAVTISLADNSATLLNSGGTNGFSGIESFTGDGAGVADDVFRGPDATNAWNFASATSGTVAGSTWSDFATLRGGDLVDTFNVSQAYTGTLEGGLEDDIFNLTVDSTATALGQDGDDTFNLTDGVTLTAITGGETGESATGDRLVVLGGNTTTVNALDAGSVSLADADVQAFSEIESIRGDDAAADTFAFTGIGALTGIVEGADPVGTDGATDVLDVSASNAAVTISLADNSATLLNSGGTNGFSGIESFTGDGAGVADDVFRGPDAANAWNFASATSGTVAGSTWNDFATLRGGDLVDTFNVSQAYTGTLEGGFEDDIFNLTVDSTATALGQDGDDTFNLNAGLTGADGDAGNDIFNFNGGDATTVSGGDGDDTFNLVSTTAVVTATIDGGEGAETNGDTIAGSAAANTFVVNAADAGTVNGTAFSNVEDLTGGAAGDTFTFTAALTGTASGAGGDDTFNINDGGNLVQSIDGGAQDTAAGDTVSFAARTAAVTVAYDAYTDVETLTGSAQADTLTGTAAADTFTVSAVDAGTADLTAGGATAAFSSFENLDGLAGNDTFNMNAGLTGATGVDGGANTDEIVGTAAGNTFAVSSADTGTVNGTAFSNVEDLTGGAAGDTFTMNADVSGTIDGAGGSDEIIGAATGNTFVVSGADGGAVNATTFANIETLTGGADADSFELATGTQSGDLTIIGNGGADTADVSGDLVVSGDVSISSVETVTASGGSLSANLLTITGASSGIGSAGNELSTNVGSVEIIGAGDVYLTELNELNILGIDSTGDVSVETGAEMVLARVSANGTVTLVALTGNIVNGNGDLNNIEGAEAFLAVLQGSLGTDASPITILVTRIDGQPTITIQALGGAILNPNLANVLEAAFFDAGFAIDSVSQGVSTAVNRGVDAGVLSASEKIGFVDWAGMDPDIRLVDCLEPCIKLPADQLEDEELAGLREPTQMLVIRTVDGIKLIPVFVQHIAQRSPEVGETDHDGPVLN